METRLYQRLSSKAVEDFLTTTPHPAAAPITAIAAITGTPQVGQVLTAGALTPSAATATYQWTISDISGGTYTDIGSATSNTYTSVAGDATKFIKVVATGTGSYSGTVTSAATTAVAAAPLAIGDSYQGGIIAYIFVSGDTGYVEGQTHGLIVAIADQTPSGAGIQWALLAYQSTSVPGTLTTIGSGSANTDKIIEQNGAGSTYAAGLARSCTDGSYHDWFLPSKEELNQLYLNQASIGVFSAGGYWSSSEVDLWKVSAQYFSGGSWDDLCSKNTPNHRVRAVRSF